jgi:TonB family protein
LCTLLKLHRASLDIVQLRGYFALFNRQELRNELFSYSVVMQNTSAPMIRKILHTALILFCLSVLASCASKPSKLGMKLGKPTEPSVETTAYTSNGAVSAEIILAPEESRYKVTFGVSFANPTPTALNATPIYPSDLLAKRLDPIEVIARVIVNAAGSVDTASITRNSSAEQAFADATLTAVKGWTFSPLKRIDGALTEPLPFTQEYRFTFKQADGRAIVYSGVRQ